MKRHRYRSAVTGKFVTREYAEAHPRETVAEEVKPVECIVRIEGP